jgi:hypothetical protein
MSFDSEPGRGPDPLDIFVGYAGFSRSSYVECDESFKGAAGRLNHRGGRPRRLDAVRPQRVMGRVGSLAEPFLRLRGRMLLRRSRRRYSETGAISAGTRPEPRFSVGIPEKKTDSQGAESVHRTNDGSADVDDGPCRGA